MAVPLLCFATENAEELSRAERELRALAARAFSLARTACLPIDTEPIMRDLADQNATMVPDRDYLANSVTSGTAGQFVCSTLIPGLCSTNETGEIPLVRSYKRARHARSLHDSLGKQQAHPADVGSLGELPLSKMSIDNLLRFIPQIDPIVTLNSASLSGALSGSLPTTCGQTSLAINHQPATRHASHKRVQGLGAVNLNTGLRCAVRGMVVNTERPTQAGILSGAVGSSLYGGGVGELRGYSAYCKQQEDGRSGYRWDQPQSQRVRGPRQVAQQMGQWGYVSKPPQRQQHYEHGVLQEWKRSPEWINQNQNPHRTSLLKADEGHPATDGLYSRKRYQQRETAPYFTTYTGHYRAKLSMAHAAYEQAGRHRPWIDLAQQQAKRQQQQQQRQWESSHQTRHIPAAVNPQVQLQEDQSQETYLEKGVPDPRTAAVEATPATPHSPPQIAKRSNRGSPAQASASFEGGEEQAHGGNYVKEKEHPAVDGAPELRPDAGGLGDGSVLAAAPTNSAGQQAASALTTASGLETQQEQQIEEEHQVETCSRQHSPPPPLQPQPVEQPRTETEASETLEAVTDGRGQECSALHALGCGAASAVEVSAPQTQPQSCSGGGGGGLTAEAPQPSPVQARSWSSQDTDPSRRKKKRKRKGAKTSKQKSKRRKVSKMELAAAAETATKDSMASAEAPAEAAACQEAAEVVANSQEGVKKRRSSNRKSKRADASPPQAALSAQLKQKPECRTRQPSPHPKEYSRLAQRRLADGKGVGELPSGLGKKLKGLRLGRSPISSRRSAPSTETKQSVAAAVKATSALPASKASLSALTDRKEGMAASKSEQKVLAAASDGGTNTGEAKRHARGADCKPSTGSKFKGRVSDPRANLVVGATAHMTTDASDLAAKAGREAAPGAAGPHSPPPRRGEAGVRTRANCRITRSSAACRAAEASDLAEAEEAPVKKVHSPRPSDKRLRAAKRALERVGDGDGSALPLHPEPTASRIHSENTIHDQSATDGASAEGLVRPKPYLPASGTLPAETAPFASSATEAPELQLREDGRLQDEAASNGSQKFGAGAQNHASSVPKSGVRMAAPLRPVPLAAATALGTAGVVETKPERRYKPVAPVRRPPHARAGGLPSTHAELAAVAAAILASQQATGRMAEASNATPADDIIIASEITSADAAVKIDADVTKAAGATTEGAAKECDPAAAAAAAAPRAVPPPSASRPADLSKEETLVQDPAVMSADFRAVDGGNLAGSAQPTSTSAAYDGTSLFQQADIPALNLPKQGTDRVPAVSLTRGAATRSAATASGGASRREPATAAATVHAAAVRTTEPEHQEPAGAADIDANVPLLHRPLSDKTATSSQSRQRVIKVDVGGKRASPAGAVAETAAPAEQSEAEVEAEASEGVRVRGGDGRRCSDTDGRGVDNEGRLSRRSSCPDCASGAMEAATMDADGEGSGNEGVRSKSRGDGPPERWAAAAPVVDPYPAGGRSREGAGGNEIGQEQDERGEPEMSEVEREEWRRRRAEIERQRAEAAAEREAARRARVARSASSATEELERRIRQRLADHHQLASAAAAEAAAKEEIRARVRANLQERFSKALEENNLSRMLKQLGLLPKGQYLRTAEQRSKALKVAKIRFHPDKVTGSLEERVNAEEISKLLNSWMWNK